MMGKEGLSACIRAVLAVDTLLTKMDKNVVLLLLKIMYTGIVLSEQCEHVTDDEDSIEKLFPLTPLIFSSKNEKHFYILSLSLIMFSNVPARLSWWGTLRMGPGDSASAGLVGESATLQY